MFLMRKNRHQSSATSKLRRCSRWPSTRLVWTERRKRYNSLWSLPFTRWRANNVRGRVATKMTILMSHASRRNPINARLQRSKKDTWALICWLSCRMWLGRPSSSSTLSQVLFSLGPMTSRLSFLRRNKLKSKRIRRKNNKKYCATSRRLR